MKPVIIELTDAKTKQVVDSLEVDACLVATGRAPYTQARFALLMVSELMSLSCGTSGKLCLLFVWQSMCPNHELPPWTHPKHAAAGFLREGTELMRFPEAGMYAVQYVAEQLANNHGGCKVLMALACIERGLQVKVKLAASTVKSRQA